MANANTNLMSINISQPTTSTGSNSRNSGLQSKYNSKNGKSDFNSALDKATNQINQQNQPVKQDPAESEELQSTNATEPDAKQPVESKDAKTQGENTQPQDAPQSLPTEKSIPAEIQIQPENISNVVEIQPENILPNVEIQPENISPNVEIETTENLDVPEIPAAMPLIFTANTETLLPAQATENTGEVNLMTIMPKNDGDKSQAMLNFLSGKTWTAEDVKATLSPQVPQNVEVNPETLPIHQSGKNFTFNPIQNQSQNAENLQPQIQNQSVILNPEQVQQPQIQNQQANLNLVQPQIQDQSAILNPEQVQQPQIQNPSAILNFEQQPQIQNQQVNLNLVQQPQVQNQPQVELSSQPILNSLQPQIQMDFKQVNQSQQISDLLGANVPVEENQSSAPLPHVQQIFRQQPEQNQQQTNQNLQQTFSQNLNSEMQTQQQNSGGEEIFTQNITPTTNNVSTVQTAAQVQNPEATAQAARENENIPAQIVEQARMIRTAENTEMVINLKPEHLGQLTLRVSVSQNGAVNASFYSDNAQVRAAIENSIVQLKQELNDQGLKVENVQVYAGLTEGGLTNGQGGQAWQQNQQQPTTRRIDFDAIQDEVDAVNPVNANESTDGVDYKV